MGWRLAITSLLIGFVMECIPHHFHFVDMNKTWTEAQHYCREHYTDLATTENMEDMQMMVDTAKGYEGTAWIGLHQTAVPSWKWSLADEGFYGPGEANFTNWMQGEPSGGDREDCAELVFGAGWNDKDCTTTLPFVCYDETHSTTERYVLIEEKKSWREAQKYCRENHTDLVSVRYEEENQQITEKAGENLVWIGLFRDNWTWSDPRTSSFRHWRSDALNYQTRDNCAVAWLTEENQGKWKESECDEQHPFFCRLDKLQLVKRNLTWTEALMYCRQHHMDLVSITSPEIQGWVMEEAKRASTEQVWLGLRYLCPLNIWFWVSGETVCPENWAEERENENGREGCCGNQRAGALQSGEKWVSLPDSTRLNFICAAGTETANLTSSSCIMTEEIRLSLFLSAGLCAGLPTVIWALYSLRRHQDAGGHVSAFAITLIFSNMMELFSSPFLVAREWILSLVYPSCSVSFLWSSILSGTVWIFVVSCHFHTVGYTINLILCVVPVVLAIITSYLDVSDSAETHST
ncbi:C-type mannose receptor 2-like [Sardina pilchardus]|uniref:C-type mannose receptor 2-like n=1 Tax=Sardina pilchardus TaxID=27697 RepID=UPI002E11E659